MNTPFEERFQAFDGADGNPLRVAMVRERLTVKKLAKKIGCCDQRIYDAFKDPLRSLKTACYMMAIFHVPADEVFFVKDHDPSDRDQESTDAP